MEKMKFNIQLFGGRGQSAGGGNTGSFYGEISGGAKIKGVTGAETRYFAGDKVTRQSDGKEFTVTEARGNKIELYSGDETLHPATITGFQFKERGLPGQRLLARQRTNILRTADDRTTINGRMVAMFNKTPKGFIKLEGATTAPKGYDWYSNGKSRFGDEYINILVKQKRRK